MTNEYDESTPHTQCGLRHLKFGWYQCSSTSAASQVAKAVHVEITGADQHWGIFLHTTSSQCENSATKVLYLSLLFQNKNSKTQCAPWEVERVNRVETGKWIE